MFHYQTPKTDVVNWVTNQVTDQSFFDQLTDLMDKLGAEGETYVLLDQNGTLFAGEVVVPEAVIEVFEAGGDRDAWTNGPNVNEMPDGEGNYRAQWWVRHNDGREAFTALGIHGQWIYIDRGHNTAFLRQASQRNQRLPQRQVERACDRPVCSGAAEKHHLSAPPAAGSRLGRLKIAESVAGAPIMPTSSMAPDAKAVTLPFFLDVALEPKITFG